MTILGEGFVAISPETSGFGSLEAMLKTAVGAIPMPAVFAAVVGGAAVAAFSIGESFEGAYRTIRSATGATEEQMSGLEDSFKKVLSSGPSSMNAVADALSLVSQRTKLSGADLEAYTETELKLARITKTDVKELVDQTTKAFANYGIQGLEPSKQAMEGLLQVSQNTGISVSALSQAVSGKAGASFRALGVDITSAASIMGTLEAAGVSTGPVIMSLSKAITTAQGAGKDAKTALADIFDTLKNGVPGTAAYEDAIKSLGSRGFQSLRDAISTGKLSIEEFTGSMAVIPGQIDRIAQENQTLGGLFQTLKNQALVALEPIALGFVKILNSGARALVEDLTIGINAMRAAFSGEGITSDGWVGAFERVGVAARAAWPTVLAIGEWIRDHWQGILIAAGAAMFIFGGSFLTVAAGFAILYARSEGFRNAINTIIEILIEVGQAAYSFGQVIVATVAPIIADFAHFFIERWDKIKAALTNVLIGIKVAIAIALAPAYLAWKYFNDQILAVVMLVWREIQVVISTAVRIIGDIFDLIIAVLTGQWGDAWNAIKDIFGAAFDFLVATFGNLLAFAWDFFSSLPGNILSALGDLAGVLLPKALELLGGLLTGLWNALPGIIEFFLTLPFRILGLLVGADVWLAETGLKILTGLWDGIQVVVPIVMGFFLDLPGKILGLLAAAPSWLLNVGADVIHGLWNGINSMWSWFTGFVSGIPGWVVGAIGDLTNLLHDAAVDLIVGLWNALASMKDWLFGKIGDLAGGIMDAFKNPLKIFSPSRVFFDYGINIGEGLAQGLESMAGRVSDSQRRAFAGLGQANLPGVANAFQSPNVSVPMGPGGGQMGDLVSALTSAVSGARQGPLIHMENVQFGSVDAANDVDWLLRTKFAGI